MTTKMSVNKRFYENVCVSRPIICAKYLGLKKANFESQKIRNGNEQYKQYSNNRISTSARNYTLPACFYKIKI